jgi:hypothetical protein
MSGWANIFGDADFNIEGFTAAKPASAVPPEARPEGGGTGAILQPGTGAQAPQARTAPLPNGAQCAFLVQGRPGLSSPRLMR